MAIKELYRCSLWTFDRESWLSIPPARFLFFTLYIVCILLNKPKECTFDEMVTLLSYFEYNLKQGGTGSGVKFIREKVRENTWSLKLHITANKVRFLLYSH